jgi:acyl-coenzyme A synthetase/AMP-(fatty) acid ligase
VRDILLRPNKKVVFLFSGNDVESILCYLGILKAGHAIHVSPKHVDEAASARLIEQYRPDIVLWRRGTPAESVIKEYDAKGELLNYCMVERRCPQPSPYHELAMLLTTSGSTGSPKFVRLSFRNIAANACQIVSALGIQESDRAVHHMHMSYVFGLSVINSHLAAGASILCNSRSVIDRKFWHNFDLYRPTSLSGVPHTVFLLQQAGMDFMSLPSLRTMTQAGGKLDRSLTLWLVEKFFRRGVRTFFMYGQTEAAGRISVLPIDLIEAKLGSVGLPIDHGRIEISPTGEVIFSGPNVMLGYAHERADLGLGDMIGGQYATGDLGRIDPDGCLFISGRAARFAKICGSRISLDDVESRFHDIAPVTAISDDQKIMIFHEGDCRHALEKRADELLDELSMLPSSIKFFGVEKIPRSENGKVLYDALKGFVA